MRASRRRYPPPGLTEAPFIGPAHSPDARKVKFVFADFPIVQIHPEAALAAMAVDCAGDQNKYWQYHDKVFREQDRQGDFDTRWRRRRSGRRRR
jgi:hypothetical protein